MSQFSKLWKKPAKSTAIASGSETSPPDTIHSAGKTPIDPQDSSQKQKSGFRASVRKHLSRNTPTSTREPSPAASRPTSAQNISISVPFPGGSPQNLLSERKNIQLKTEKVDAETRTAMLDLGIQVIDLFQPVASTADLVLPNPLGDILEMVTGILEVLKKMIENREAWKQLLLGIDNHQEVFNAQLRRMKLENLVPDPESPLLSPVKGYADALESLAAKVMEESGLLTENTTPDGRWSRVKKFGSRFLNADSESQSIEGYTQQLQAAMDQFNLALSIFTSFTVHYIKGGVDSLGQSVKDLRETVIRTSGPKDTINSRHITALGGQHSTCLPGTRVDVLEELRQWARDQRVKSPIYSIRDVAGTGKSTIARTLVDELDDSNRFAFFFSQEDSSVQNASDFCFFVQKQIRAYCHDPNLAEYWNTLSAEALDLLRSKPIENQWKKLVYGPLSRLPHDQIYVLVIDALDECTVPTRGALLQCLLDAYSSGSLPHLRVLLTTRNEEDIRSILDRDDYRGMIHSKTLLQSVNTNADVALYVNHRLDERSLFVSSPAQRDLLITRCNGLFIFASLACDLLEDAGTEAGPLSEILERFTSLDSLYHEVLRRADRKPEYTRPALAKILGIILVAQEPLSITAIAELLSTPVKEVESIVGRLGSVLSIGMAHQPIAILHATFSEFLVRRMRATTEGETVTNEYAISKPQSNRLIAGGCRSVLLKGLKRDPCGLRYNYGEDTADSGISLIVEDRIQQSTTAAIRYAASAWIAHIIPDLHIQQIIDDMRKIFHEKLLNWIELAALLRRLPDCMSGVHGLQEALSNTLRLSNCAVREDDVQWCRDILEFMQSNQNLLSQHPLQVYSSALTFTPCQSQIYQVYADSSVPKIVMGHPTRTWGTLVLMGHINSVNAVTYSACGELLVSAADGGEIVVWDARTGARQWDHKLEGEEMCIGVRVLPGSRVIVSVWVYGSWWSQKYTRLYCLSCETRGLLCPAENLDISGESVCMSWAPDLNQFACGTHDGIVHLFTLGGQIQGISSIQAHEERVESLSFAHDGLTMASTSWGEIKIWSVTPEGLTGPTAVCEHTKNVLNGAFSPVDPSLFAFVDDNSLHLYNISANTIDFSFECEYDGEHDIVYSHDGKQIAVRGTYKHSIQIINTVDMDQDSTPVTREIATSHTGLLNCHAFSPDDRYLVTGSNDESLRIHDLASTAPQTTATGHQYGVYSLSFSLDGRWLASVDWRGSLYNWNVETGNLIQDAVDIRMRYSCVAMSSDGSIAACASRTNDIRLWSMESKMQIGAKLSLGYPNDVNVRSMVFSSNDTKLAVTTSKKQIVIIDMQLTHALSIRPLITINLDFDPERMPLAFHLSGKYICCGDHAWRVTSSNPNSLTGDQLGTILKETFSLLLRCDHRASSPSISLGSPTPQVFYTPLGFDGKAQTTHDGRIALGAWHGGVMVIDFTHLATKEEKVLLDRAYTMRRETAARSGPSRLHEILSSYSGLPRIVIHEDHSEAKDYSDPQSSESSEEDTEDEDGEDGEEAEDKEEEDGGDVVE